MQNIQRAGDLRQKASSKKVRGAKSVIAAAKKAIRIAVGHARSLSVGKVAILLLTHHLKGFEMKLDPDDREKSPFAKSFYLARSEGHSDRVEKLLNDAFSNNDPRAAYAFATWYLFGVRRRKNFRKGADLLKIAASAAIGLAARDLAVSYECGKGVPRDKTAAFNLYIAALACGDTAAAEEVARCLYWGIGTAKDRYAANIIYKAFEESKATTKKKPSAKKSRRGASKAAPPKRQASSARKPRTTA